MNSKELKATDLRIGSWVLYRNYKGETNSDKSFHPLQIASGRQIDFLADHPKRYKPIEISPEWLEKIGFELVDDYHTLYANHFCIEISFFSDKPVLFLESNENAPIEYVHQLQNLYHSLTGQELTIKVYRYER